jgi:hypothetical protein
MRWAERGMLAAGLLLAGYAMADPPSYGKVETFQPGKKYNCVPTGDRKGWDCSESGKADRAPAPAQNVAPSAAPAAQAPPQAAMPTRAAETPPKASALPGYLMNSTAGNRPATVTPPPTPKAEPVPEPAAAPAESKPEAKAPEPTPAPAPKTEPPAPPVAAVPAVPEPQGKAPKQSSAPVHAEADASASKAQLSTPSPVVADDFLALSSNQYVVELARASSAGELVEPALPSGRVYKVHLRQNGNDGWLLFWGPFDSVETARSAREKAIAQNLTPGWPRPIGPLQAEMRRISE